MTFLRQHLSDYKAILSLGLPILVGQLGSIVVGFADNIMVGHYSTAALASASFVNNLFNIVFFCCIGFTYGITPLVGALFSQGSRNRIGALLRTAIRLNIAFSLALTAIMTVLYFHIDKLGQPPELLPLIRPYYLIYLAGIVPVSLFNAFAQWSYGIKNTSMPMWIVLSANAVNIAGNYMLIYGNFGFPELGLNGAGISTLVARLICPCTIILIFFFNRKYSDYRQGFRRARPNREQTRLVWSTSIPVSMQMTFESGSFSAAGIMAGWIGTVSLAAFQVIVIVGMFGFCLYYAVGAAVAVLVANEHGRGSTPGMRRVAWSGYHVMLAVSVCSSLLFALSGRHLMALFSEDMAVISLGATLIVPLILYQLGDATQITFANALRGTSKVMPMLWIAFVSYVIVGLPATYLLAFTAGLSTYGIILSFSVSLFTAGALFLLFFLRATRVRM